MHLLHENPVLSRAQLRTVLGGVAPVDGHDPASAPFGTLSAIDLADQVELIKITPVFLTPTICRRCGRRCRPAIGLRWRYMVSVVLIQGRRAGPRPPRRC